MTAQRSRSRTEQERVLEVRIWRGGQDGRFESYRVPGRDNQTVLDVVTYVQRHLDPTLAYRFACRVGMCGSCAMEVNGRPRWTCRTHVRRVARRGRLAIAPLSNLPVVRDLVVDMAPFFEKWVAARGRFVPPTRKSAPTPASSTVPVATTVPAPTAMPAPS